MNSIYIQEFALVYVAASLLCFAMYARDKWAARTGRRRTRESTLLLLGFACGWPGAVVAQRCLRHKSSKHAFRVKFGVTVVLNVLALIALAVAGTY